MNYEDLLRDFVRRTRHNVELTERWRQQDDGAGFNEVTNLINSLLGLVILPSEKVQQFIVQARVTASGIPEWNSPFRVAGANPPRETRPLLTGLRNAAAHGNIDFESDGHNIIGVTFAQTAGRNGPEQWRATFLLEELQVFLTHLADEVERACDRKLRSGANPA